MVDYMVKLYITYILWLNILLIEARPDLAGAVLSVMSSGALGGSGLPAICA